MGKYEFIKTGNLVPVHKELIIDYENGYNGAVKQLIFKIYPFTVKEKTMLQQSNAEGTKLLEKEETREQGEKLITDATYDATYVILKKDDPEVDIETVKQIPFVWLNKIIYKALEFEGVTEKQIKDITSKKALDQS